MKILLTALILCTAAHAETKSTRKISSKGASTVCYDVNMIDYSANQNAVATLSDSKNATLSVTLSSQTLFDAYQLALTNGLQVCLLNKDQSHVTVLSKKTILE